MAKKVSRICQLSTDFSQDLEYSWADYPRPQFKRDSYISLCGQW